MAAFRYEWKSSYFSHLDAALVGAHIQSIQEKTPLTTAVLVEDGKRPESPIHTVFNWDDTAAAQLYRQTQAGHLLREMVVVAVTDDKTQTARNNAYVSVSIDSQKQYVPTVIAMQSPEMREQVLVGAMRELRSFEAKYASLKELRAVMDAISEVIYYTPLPDPDKTFREKMLDSAQRDMANFVKKYGDLEDVAPVVAAIMARQRVAA